MSDRLLIGVLSDTHITQLDQAAGLADKLMAGPFRHVDALLHAGDMVIPELESCFVDIPVYSVRGNMDAPRSDLPIKRIVSLGGYRLGLLHGWGAPGAVAANAYGEFDNQDVDAIIFGHSHTPWLQRVGDVLLFNPGSATDHRGHAPACSVGLLELGKQINAVHIYEEEW